MGEFLQVLKRIVAGDDSVTSSDVIFATRGEDVKTTPAFIFWATVGTPKFDLFLEFWNQYPSGPEFELDLELANPNCYHFYGQKKKFQFSKAIDDLVVFSNVMRARRGWNDESEWHILPSFAGVFIKYAKENDWSLFHEYKLRVYMAYYGVDGEFLARETQFSISALLYEFAWLGNPEQLKRLCTVDGTYSEPVSPAFLVGSKYRNFEPNVHAPPEYTKIMISYITREGSIDILGKVIRNLPSDLMVFDPRTGETRAVESFTKLFDFYLHAIQDNTAIKPSAKFLKTEMVNKLATIGFTPDALKWLANSHREVKIAGGQLRIKMSDARLLMADPRIVSIVDDASTSWTESLSELRKRNKTKVDGVIGVLMEKGMMPNMIDMIILAAMPWQVVWVGVDDNRKLGPKSEALSSYIRSKVAELQEKGYNERPKKAARTKMLMVSRRFSEEDKEIVNKLRPLFSDSIIVEDKEADKLLGYENIIMSYTDMISDAADDGRLPMFFQAKIHQARSRTDSNNFKLLETAIQRIQISEEPMWNKENKDGKKLKDVVLDAYWQVKNETD